ncbi:hypothetical protein ABDK00_013165 [Niabella insulamsoli]|uniref:hypothetical protein n=1 Tax=Niabella insulamsoli TaxID=3144874 RepID=UPI0031FD67BB
MSDNKKNVDAKSSTKVEECFVIMPITDPDGYESGHFQKVFEDIISPACKEAGFQPTRAEQVKQTNLIHLDILERLIKSPMVICDLSSRNPNVLFELGMRQAFDKPTVLIQEKGTKKIFDISPMRILDYNRELKYRDVIQSQKDLKETILATKKSTSENEGINSLVKLLSLSQPAALQEISEKDSTSMLQVLMAQMNDLKNDLRKNFRPYSLFTTNPDVKNVDEELAIFYFLLKKYDESITVKNLALASIKLNELGKKYKNLIALDLTNEERQKIDADMNFARHTLYILENDLNMIQGSIKKL